MADGLSPRPPGRARGRPFGKGRSGNPAGRQTGSRNKATLAAAAFLAGESEALTRRAVELALTGDPTAMRLCLERILPPCRERTVKFALPPIESAPTGQSPWAEGPRYCRGDEGGHLGAGRRRDHAGRGAEDRGGRRHLCPGHRCQRLRPAPAGNRRRVQGARGGPHCRLRIALAQQPIGECLLLICCKKADVGVRNQTA
jgi:hypothetical protein